MRKTFKKIAAGVMAAATLAVGMAGMSASAYSSQDTWRIFIVKDAPSAPNQRYSDKCSFPAYSGGYQSYCSSITGSNDRKVNVSSNLGLSWSITDTGNSTKKTSTNGGTAEFTLTGSCSNSITANGSMGYYGNP